MGKATVALAFGDPNVPSDRREKAGADLVALKVPPELHDKILDDHDKCDANCNHRYWIGHHRRGNRAGSFGRILVSDITVDCATCGGAQRRNVAQRPVLVPTRFPCFRTSP